MNNPDQSFFGDGLAGDRADRAPEATNEELDQLLGEDVDPTLSVEAKRAIVARVRAAEDAALDRLLDLDGIAVPDGLGQRVLSALQGNIASARDHVLTPAAPRRPRLLLVCSALGAAAAAAALLLVLKKAKTVDAPPIGGESPMVADATDSEAIPSDEFLALLPALENVDFLIDELDPLEADALFLFEAEDELLLDFLDENG